MSPATTTTTTASEMCQVPQLGHAELLPVIRIIVYFIGASLALPAHARRIPTRYIAIPVMPKNRWLGAFTTFASTVSEWTLAKSLQVMTRVTVVPFTSGIFS